MSSNSNSMLGRRVATHLLIAALFFSFWEFCSRVGIADPLLMPAPSGIALAFWTIAVAQPIVWPHFFITLGEAFAGFLLGAGTAILLATVASLMVPLRRYLSPYVVWIQVTPNIALAPLAIAWFGFGFEGKIALAAIACFFPPYVMTITALLDTDRDSIDLFRVLRANRWQVFWGLTLRKALPAIMAGLRTAMTMALIGAIVGEFVSANAGLGLLVQRFTFALQMEESFACLFMLSGLGLALFFLMEFADTLVIFWRHEHRLNRIVARSKRKHEELLAPRTVASATSPA